MEYGEDFGFDDIIEYVGPEEERRKVEREIARLMTRLVKGAEVKVDWSQALCLQKIKEDDKLTLDTWFCPGDTKPTATAVDICFECPIRKQCLQFACAAGERFGTWGGIPENLRAGKGEGHDKDIPAYDYEKLVELPNVYNVTSRKFRYHRSRLKDWTPGQEYTEENFAKWKIAEGGNGSNS